MRTSALSFLLAALPAFAIDLTRATVVAPGAKAVTVLVEEVEKRTQIRWPVAVTRPASGASIAISNTGAGPAEGYTIRTTGGSVEVAGNDARGVLFGVGHLLRTMRMSKGRIELPDNFAVTTAPKYPLRGHQLGYRPKTNSYDGWTLAQWDQYIRDLAIFGANAIELIPPRSDDNDDSPHFPLPKMETMIGMSKIAGDYGLDLWIWYPALDKDYADPATVEFALKEWAEVFRRLPRIDAVFVPGGDPGHTQPKHLMPMLEKQAASLRRFHPKAQMWVAPQGFTQPWMDEFYGILRTEPAWLNGIVFGPQIRVGLPALRAAVPKRYPIRHYPDITHTLRSQYMMPDWDLGYALTLGREPINPRPIDQARIFRLLQPSTNGFITYSEGCNDDVNKAVWSGLGWNPDTDVTAILRDYSRYYIGERYTDTFAQGLLALERNWRGPLLTNEGVYTTLAQFRSMDHAASPADLANWRFQQAQYRAHYDAYTRSRLIYETRLEDEAMAKLRQARSLGTLVAMHEAETILDRAVTDRTAPGWRGRVFELAEALFQSIRMQLSVEWYKAIAVGRGANLDAIDAPLNNRLWLKERFGAIRARESESARLPMIQEIVEWTNPGPGGFYDDLGNLTMQSHLVRGPAYDKDPAHLERSLVGFGVFAGGPAALPWRTSWLTHAEALGDSPLQMRYRDLDPTARYRVRIVYSGENTAAEIRLVAGERWEVHPWRRKELPPRPVQFDIPAEATAGGELSLTWTKTPGLGGAGRGLQIAEVWLERRP